MEKIPTIFSFGCKTYMRHRCTGQTKHPSCLLKMTVNNLVNIRDYIIDFIYHFGEQT